MAKRLLDDWGVPPPNRSPDERRAIALHKLHENFDPGLPALSGTQESAGQAPPEPVIQPRVEPLRRTEREAGKMGRIPATKGHYRFEESSDLSLYDDLGVPTNATQDEIRQAHKALARLLHPDQILDQYTKGLAETTLKRINAAYAVLGDPRQRRNYDEEAAPACPPLPYPSHPQGQGQAIRWQSWPWQPFRRNLLWIGATLACLAVIYWILWPGRQPEAEWTARSPAAAPWAPSPASPASVPPASKPQLARHAVSRQVRRPQAVLPALAPVGPRPAVPPPVIAPLEIAVSITGALPPPPAFTPAAASPGPPPARLAHEGLWIYPETSKLASKQIGYLPEFIELAIRYTNGFLKGRFTARYRVANQPISPEVQFRFEGAPLDSGASYSWSGNGGARGQVRLHSIGDHQLQVTWHTTQPGPEARLVSGSALLVRRQAP
ncbi:MAG: J domain-containing protein [Bryobacterales bacterium]|nr:J domain-containing protein [Bryobacterales bacterium]